MAELRPLLREDADYPATCQKDGLRVGAICAGSNTDDTQLTCWLVYPHG